MVIDPNSATPIWGQIVELVKHKIARDLAPGVAVPSVRDLAQHLTVNPATVAKAYRRLVADGYLVVKRGQGTFVSESSPKPARKKKRRELEALAGRFAAEALTLGATRSEAEAAVRSALKAAYSPAGDLNESDLWNRERGMK